MNLKQLMQQIIEWYWTQDHDYEYAWESQSELLSEAGMTQEEYREAVRASLSGDELQKFIEVDFYLL